MNAGGRAGADARRRWVAELSMQGISSCMLFFVFLENPLVPIDITSLVPVHSTGTKGGPFCL
jgi:hypothetical protein